MQRLFFLGLLLLFSGCRSTAFDEFKQLYADRDALVKKRDVNGLLAQMTPEYIVKLRNGETMTGDQLRERWTFYYDKVLIRHIAFVDEIRSVDQRGNEALVTFEQQDRRIQNGADGKPMEVEANVIHRDIWTRTAAGWKLRLTEEGQQTKFTINGQPQPIP
jgi:ketosteroid isomerase-like protein